MINENLFIRIFNVFIMKENNTEIIAYARGLSQYYQDGMERMEIHISATKYKKFFPDVYSKAFPVEVKIDDDTYIFFFRKTVKNEYLWLCPYVLDNTIRLRLCDILKEHNIIKNDRLKIIPENNNRYIIRKIP